MSVRRAGVGGGLALVALLSALVLGGCGIGYMVDVPIRSAGWMGVRGRLVDATTGQAVPQVRVVVRRAQDASPDRPYYVFSTRDGGFQLNRFTVKGEPTPLIAGERYILLFSAPTHRVRQYPVVYQGGAHELGIIELSEDEMAGRMRPIIPGRVDAEGERDPDTLRRIGPPVP